MKIKVAQVGLGPIGLETLKAAAEKRWLEVVGAVDIAPDKAGRDLADLTGIRSLRGLKAYASAEELVRKEKPDIVLHTTVSQFARAHHQFEFLAGKGISVVSSCEELVFPRLRNSRLAARLDSVCRKHQARIVGTGVNPGFVMDILPLFLTCVCLEVRAVDVQRVVNASTRRGPLQKKIGSGQAPATFAKLLNEGKAGHAGLRESAALIAHALGWKAVAIVETARPVVAARRIRTKFFSVKKGEVCGIHQRAEARLAPGKRLTLDIQMYLDAKNPRDAVQVQGTPAVDMVISGGVAGDQATVAALLNTAARVLDARPGLLLLTDLSLPRIAG